MSEVQLWIQAAEEKLPLLHCNVQGVTPGNKSQVSKLFQHVRILSLSNWITFMVTLPCLRVHRINQLLGRAKVKLELGLYWFECWIRNWLILEYWSSSPGTGVFFFSDAKLHHRLTAAWGQPGSSVTLLALHTVQGCVQGTVGEVERARQHLTREASPYRWGFVCVWRWNGGVLSQVWKRGIQGIQDDGV